MSGAEWFELAYKVIGGLGVFLVGMMMLSEALQTVASDFIRKVIGWLTNNRVMAVGVGVIVTTIVQSSSITTVMVVGFVNAGLMSLAQAVGVIMGANVGTTITGWIIAVQIGKYGLLFIGAGFIPYLFGRKQVPKAVGKMLIALGLIFLGLEFMSGGFKPLSNHPEFIKQLTIFDARTYASVVACVAVGCVLTLVVQSSSAMLGITIALAITGVIPFQTAAALVLGENIGTTITALLASIGGNVSAKRAATAHSAFNVIGVSYMVVIFPWYVQGVDWFVEHAPSWVTSLFAVKSGEAASGVDPLIAMKIAAVHSGFNVFNTILFLPFMGALVRFVTWLRPDKGAVQKKRLKLLGSLSTVSPELALGEAEGEVELMGGLALEGYAKASQYLLSDTELSELADRVKHLEQITDNIQMEVTLFLTEVMQAVVTQEQATRGYALIRISDEIESVLDYCQRLVHYKIRVLRDKLVFTDAAKADLKGLADQVGRFLDAALKFSREHARADNQDPDVRALIVQADAIAEACEKARDSHLQRVRDGSCDALAGIAYSDMVTGLLRIKNHTVNIIDARVGRWEQRREALHNLDRDNGDTDRLLAASTGRGGM